MVFLITQKELKEEIPEKIIKNEKFFHIKWTDIKDLLEFYSERVEEDKTNKFFLNQFIKFMEMEGMRSFSGFAKQEYGPFWQKYTEFRGSAERILVEVKEIMIKKGFQPRRWEGENYDSIGYYFLPKKYRWKFPYYVGFNVEENTVWVTVSIEFQKLFREFVREKYFEETEDVSAKLGDDFIVVWDRDWIYRTEKLVNLIKEAKNKNMQKEKILTFIKETIKKFEKSGLIQLLTKAAKEYK